MSLSENVIYFDNNSTTKTSMKAKEAYNLIQDEYFANPSSQSILGLEANKLLEKSKVGIKKLLNANNYNLYITSGATEANNIILKTYLEKALKDKKTVVTSKLEHSSVLKLFKIYELLGLNVIYLNSKNIYSLEDLPVHQFLKKYLI
jgi:cysteine desulfurase